MTHRSLSAPGSCRRLFLGSAFAALSASLCTPSLAIASPDVGADGAQVIANDQVSSAGVSATAADPVIRVVIEPTEASADLADNSIGATATGNHHAATLAPDTLDLSGLAINTHLVIDGDTVSGQAPAVVASRQVMDDAPVTAETDYSRIGMSADGVVESGLSIASNQQQAVATGNDASGSLSLSGNGGSIGAGIVSRQSTGYGSDVSASLSGKVRVATQEVVRSDLAMDGNIQRAIATGNSAGNALATDVLSITGTSVYGPPSIVTPYGGSEVNAAYAVLSDQQADSDVSASAEGGFRTTVADSVVGSSFGTDGNALVAAAYGNDAANSASLAAGTLDAGYGAIANVTNVQAAGGATSAGVTGGATMSLSGDLVGSSVSDRNNSIQSVATANRADGNLLSVSATSISASDGLDGSGGEEGPELPFDPGYIGTARLTPYGEMTVTAPFSVQNAQSFTAPVSASVAQSATRISIGAGITGTSVAIADNAVRGTATGNSASNGLTLDANSIATAADLNALQIGLGDVIATVGEPGDRVGAHIAAQGDVVGSSLAITGNDARGTAIADNASNSLAVTGNQLSGASGHGDAVAGLSNGDLVASADFALANYQTTGTGAGEEGSTPQISSDVMGWLAVTGGDVIRSSLAIEDNSQVAAALANLAANTLSVDATALGGNGSVASGSALSSTQVGVADLSAASDLRIGATGNVVDSSVALSGNSNSALAHMNDASNTVSIHAVQIGELSGTDAQLYTDPGMPGLAVGDHVLANSQYADGSVTASALTTAGNPDWYAGLYRSAYTITGNSTSAESVANQAINALSVSAVSDGAASAGLANTQESHAGVLAAATTRLGYDGLAMSDAQALVGGNSTSALARGNAASNSLTLTGTPSSGLAPASASLAGSGTVSADAALVNSQINTGDVTALGENMVHDIALNCIGADRSELVLNGNSVSASAIGNGATNSMALASLGQLPTAAVANVQMNSGQVTARVTGATFQAIPGTLTASRLGITGNSVIASAVGNSAVTSIASLR